MNKPEKLPQRVRFEADGTVSIATGKVELGQGITTALAQIAAEELGVELHKIRILPVSTAYSPDEGARPTFILIARKPWALKSSAWRNNLSRGNCRSMPPA